MCLFNIVDKISARMKWMIVGAVTIAGGLLIISQFIVTIAHLDTLTTLSEFIDSSIFPPSLTLRAKHPAVKVKGLYLTAYSAGSPAKIQEIINLVDRTELNSIVIDIKDYSGYVLYDSRLKFVRDNGLMDARVADMAALLRKLHRRDIYVIARLSAFQDPLLAEKRPEFAIKSKKGGLWRDKNGLAWVDPTNKEVWNYVVSVAKEASRLGFDEINLDYIRFPTDGPMADIVYTHGDQKRREVIAEFFQYFSERMANEPVWISADLFGLTTEKGGEDDMMIGQRLGDAVRFFDYVCPMVYPSHYPRGYLGFVNPAEHPYEVVYNAMRSGVRRAKNQRAKLRAWIQDFDLGADYDAAKIRTQIQASDDAGADGWILWKASNKYTGEGILSN